MVPSRFKGKNMIDHIEVLGISPNEVHKSGQLTRRVGFNLDHHGHFVDVGLNGILGLVPIAHLSLGLLGN